MVVFRPYLLRFAVPACSPSQPDQLEESDNMLRQHCNHGLDDRCRDNDGTIREKRGDTLVGTLRDTYGEDFLSEFRSDTRLDTVRERTGLSLSELIHQRKR